MRLWRQQLIASVKPAMLTPISPNRSAFDLPITLPPRPVRPEERKKEERPGAGPLLLLLLLLGIPVPLAPLGPN